ncbi:hypothetical protein [Nitratidesulfovibrio sp. SRB-5]|uniref:hypothetical protein n=1 Tax=Nitratidesulfovibrio sp. SRB-5 TaxID=2872636 RepID=UPI00102776A9|nr:hypothetical protein [Nitratidesulfovibrio sp. SRB-5]MBZ2171781.1 hypothetical protein [Nitratidesulfovibrio sp. SRB-5]RXF78648.1 hypothetical protein EKK70_00250 [Desulfovibrio sp. DS-1]
MFFSKFFSGAKSEPDDAQQTARASGGTPGDASADATGTSGGAASGPGSDAGSDAGSGQSAEQASSQAADQSVHDRGRFGGLGDLLGDQERKYVLAYIVIGIVLVEFLVAIVAIWQGVANVQSMPDGTVRFRFPWGGYLVSVAAAPVVVLLVLQVIALGYTRLIKGDPVLTEAQLRQLPPWLQKMLAAVNGVPTFLLLLGVTLLATVIYYFDKVLGFVIRLGESTEHLVLWVGGGVLAAWCVGYLGRMLFAYKVRRMQEEYAYRREVLERTGMIIVDQRSTLAQLPAQGDGMMPRALPGTIDVSPSGGVQATRVLPPAPDGPSDTSYPNDPNNTGDAGGPEGPGASAGQATAVTHDAEVVPPADSAAGVTAAADVRVAYVVDVVDVHDAPASAVLHEASDVSAEETSSLSVHTPGSAPDTMPNAIFDEEPGEPGLHEPSGQPVSQPASHPASLDLLNPPPAASPKKPRVRKKPAE